MAEKTEWRRWSEIVLFCECGSSDIVRVKGKEEKKREEMKWVSQKF